eukprot:6479951-Amphidinium_carterae.2
MLRLKGLIRLVVGDCASIPAITTRSTGKDDVNEVFRASTIPNYATGSEITTLKPSAAKAVLKELTLCNQ